MTMLDESLQAIDLFVTAADTRKLKTEPTKYDAWAKLVSFVPSASVQNMVTSRPGSWAFNRVDKAFGHSLNLDYYPITVTRLPAHHGSPEELLKYIRKNLATFFDPDIGRFAAYSQPDRVKWEADDPNAVLGAVMQFFMKFISWLPAPEDGSVVASSVTDNSWIFTTIDSPDDFTHPVSGHREFGFETVGGGTYTFYTRGADRVTGFAFGARSLEGTVLSGGRAFWKAFQKRIVEYVNAPQQGGEAQIGKEERHQPAWTLGQKLYQPSGTWL